MPHWLKNYDQLATSQERQTVLDLIETGLDAIDTEKVIRSQIKLDGKQLTIKGHLFDLNKFKRILVIGFGKVSCKAAYILEDILGPLINDGIVIGLNPLKCEYIKSYQGSHPQPTEYNVEVAQQIVDMGQKLNRDDLVLTIVSGGGSALLCWPMSECRDSQKLYQAFLKTGGSISELNTVRKHISHLKGGGLAQLLYPATVIGLIFSDLPGNDFTEVASGPTYKDNSTIEDAKQIIKKYDLGNYELVETPKDDKYFEKITNIPVVSNEFALQAMKAKAESMQINSQILSCKLYDAPEAATDKILEAGKGKNLILVGGEPSLKVSSNSGSGGRNTYTALEMLSKIKPNMVFASVASDGLDNGEFAGAVVDYESRKKAVGLGLDMKDYLKRFDSLSFFKQFDHELLQTGQTEANVSDLMIFYRK